MFRPTCRGSHIASWTADSHPIDRKLEDFAPRQDIHFISQHDVYWQSR